MPFVKADIEKEKTQLCKLIASDPEARMAHEAFLARIDLQKQLVAARKRENLTQEQLAERSGMSQQAVSRLERGSGWNLSSFLKYLTGLGYCVELKKLQ